MTTLQDRQRDLFESIKSLEKDIQVQQQHVQVLHQTHVIIIQLTNRFRFDRRERTKNMLDVVQS